MNSPDSDVSALLSKYEQQLESQLTNFESESGYSSEYLRFKSEMLPELGRYERWAHTIGNLINVKIAEKDRVKIQKYLDIAHLEVTPSQAATLAILALLGSFFLSILLIVAHYLITGEISAFFIFVSLVVSMFAFYYTYTMPQRLANIWRLQASAEMVPAILYTVIYMKHTSNLERAIQFTAQNLEGPLALDFKKILYDVEIGKYPTIKQSLEHYLETWSEYAPEFVEAFHLIESSLFEPSEARRIEILEKALETILDGVYEKMLKYSREVRSPMTNMYMLGIILPTLGLALLPLASTLLAGVIQWYHVMFIFNVLIPGFVFYLVSEILMKRPGGYGEISNLENNPYYNEFKSSGPWVIAFILLIPFLILGFLPFILQSTTIQDALNVASDYTYGQIGLPILTNQKIFDFKNVDGKTVGPFGVGATLLSLFVILGLGLFISTAYSIKTKNIIKSREETKQLEKEFGSSLFQLGNRIGDGLPAEIAFGRVAQSTQGQKTSRFFAQVAQNIQQLGMNLEEAIFDKNRGAIIYYPSTLIATSMRILVESVRKGLSIAARSLIAISGYVKNIEKINQRLKDLLAEIVSDMKSNMTFLAPLLSGIVVGLATMITLILNQLQLLQKNAGNTAAAATQLGTFQNIVQLFDVTRMVPPYFIQIAIGVYIIEIIMILNHALSTVDTGRDVVSEKHNLAVNLRRGVLLYFFTSLTAIIALTILASVAIGALSA
ncbi:hypothetical protein D6817_05885 [Candidatus Pacearchaeota archaeon]|nr:MAG: hypothetical protein D6817_05885 [Candidatus Pacearchaeota archaeon]